jgi:hypothetical protein
MNRVFEIASVGILLLVGACQSTTPTDKTTKADSAENEAVEKKAAEEKPSSDLQKIAFDDDAAGSVAKGFTPAETNTAGTPAKWGVVADATAPSQPNAFGILETKNTGQTYNCALLEGEKMTDVDVTVMVKANGGVKDQGGGIMFRAKGAADYYVGRWNPVEKNVKFFVVEAQAREELAKADIDVDPKAWHALRVLVEGDRFELFLDDASVLEHRDSTHAGPGNVGLWSKADAATLFDDLVVTPLQ